MLLDELIARLDSLPEEERRKAISAAEDDLAGIRWIPSPGPQTAAYFSPADILLYGGQGGGGKGQALDAVVLTPFGYRRMGDLEVGSQVSNPDGTAGIVIAVYPLGERQLYRFTFHDGTSTEVTNDHIWLAWRSGQGEHSARLWTTDELLRRHKQWGFSIPISDAICYSDSARHKRRPVDPYLLGVLLGDGSLTPKALRITSADAGIPTRIEARGQRLLGPYQYAKRAAEYRLPEPNDVRPHLQKWGLIGRGSAEKFIPAPYLMGTVEQRMELLRGLMDTDGWADKDGDLYYCTISPRLRDDVATLARSLGAMVTLRQKQAKDQSGNGSLAYTLRIKMRNGENAFALERKRAICRGKVPQSMARRIVSIEPTRTAQAQCIKVSNRNGLYLTNDFIVTHNTDLLLGLAFTAHRRSLIMRREYTDLGAITERAIQINGGREGFNGSAPPKLRTADDRLIDFGAAKNAGDEQGFQGNPHDLLGFDEATQFLELQVRFLIGWLRTTVTGQRTRAVLATNPPLTAEGDWIIGMFRPWLDVTHPMPAKPGELRWYVTAPDGKDIEVDGPEPREMGGKLLRPMSRTFIPSSVDDNPYLAQTDYKAKLDALPEPYRSAVRDGNFMAARKDDEWQCIPTAWVRDAQRRWTPRPPDGVPMCTLACDPASGGDDETVIAMRHDGWYAPLIAIPGKETPNGRDIAGKIIVHRQDGAVVVIDMGGGYGGVPYTQLRDNDIEPVAYKGAESSFARTEDKKLGFTNKRSEAYWRFREALDPAQPGGSPIMLPDDPMLVSDLTAPRFEIGSRGIKLETKEDVVDRLGRSPDRGDAVVMAWLAGNKMANIQGGWKARTERPRVILGHEAKRRRT